MATVEHDCFPTDPTPGPSPVAGQSVPNALHRIGDVRRQQGMSLRSVARHLGTDIRQASAQEEQTADLHLSEVYRWQQALEVPVADLLVDPGQPLSRPVMERARLVRLMKTAAAILDKAHSVNVRRMAQMLVNQLVEIMPELAEVSPWHSVGQRRGLHEYGRIAEHCISEDVIYRCHGD